MAQTVTWHGKSGTAYLFELYSIGQKFNPVSGVYVFCNFSGLATLQALYVGETYSFQDRLNIGISQHDGFKRANALGATHIAVMAASEEANRLRIETDLRHGLNPSCNAQGVNSSNKLATRTLVNLLTGPH
jgi:hypothetical protein